jgi:hypothetical protein
VNHPDRPTIGAMMTVAIDLGVKGLLLVAIEVNLRVLFCAPLLTARFVNRKV